MFYSYYSYVGDLYTLERRLLWMLRVSRAGRVARGAQGGAEGRPGPRELLSSFWSRRSVGGAAPVIRQPVAQGFRPRQPPALGASARGESRGQPGQLLRPLLGQHCLPSQTAQPDRALDDARTRRPSVLFSPLAFDPVLSVFLALVFFQMIL